MIHYHDILKAFRGEHTEDVHAQLWGRKIEKNQIREISGIPPLTFTSRADYLKDYRIYGNTIQDGTPTPDNPVEVLGCGERTENLFDANLLLNIDGCTTDNGVYSFSNTAAYSQYNVHQKNGFFTTETGGTFTVYLECRIVGNYSIIGRGVCIEIRYTDGTYQIFQTSNTDYEAYTFTTDNTKSVSAIGFTYFEARHVEIKNMQVVRSSTAPDHYIPYGYKIPVTVSGVNLIDVKDASGSGYVFNINVNIPIGVYNVYNLSLSGISVASLALVDLDGTTFLNERIKFPYTINATNGISNIRCYNSNNWEVTNVMLTTGSTPPSHYEPYHEPITTPIYIGTEPLHKIGNYADYVDYKRGVVVRRIKKLVLTGEERIVSSDAANVYQVSGAEVLPYKNISGFSTHYICMAEANLPSYLPDNSIGFRTYSPYISYFLNIKISTISSADALKSYLSAQYEAGTPVTVWYVLAEPEEEPLENLLPIQTIKDTNILTADTTAQPSEMYIKGKIKEVNQNE